MRDPDRETRRQFGNESKGRATEHPGIPAVSGCSKPLLPVGRTYWETHRLHLTVDAYAGSRGPRQQTQFPSGPNTGRRAFLDGSRWRNLMLVRSCHSRLARFVCRLQPPGGGELSGFVGCLLPESGAILGERFCRPGEGDVCQQPNNRACFALSDWLLGSLVAGSPSSVTDGDRAGGWTRKPDAVGAGSPGHARRCAGLWSSHGV